MDNAALAMMWEMGSHRIALGQEGEDEDEPRCLSEGSDGRYEGRRRAE